MKHIHHRALGAALSSLILVASFGLAACGSDAPKQADTAEPGSTFCALSQTARDVGAKVDITSGNSDELKGQIADALEASKKAAAVAPKDFEDLAGESIDAQERFIEILEVNDYDVVAASATDEGKKFFQDPRFTKVQDERDAYLSDHCGIKPSEDNAGSDISLATGDEGIRQLFTLLQLNPDAGVTDEEVDCAVDALSGNISDEDIAAIANQGEVTAAGTAVFNDVVSTCGISLSGS
ncbi:MAG: hypothetical protein ABIR32_13230 [Ilumatobacteraceae bacterium]